MEVAKPKLVVDVKLESDSKPRWTLADAILADLETSATPRNIYENRWETQTTTEHATVSPLASRISSLNRSQELHSPDPSLLALPANDGLDGMLDAKEYYRARSPGQPVYSSTITISKSVYNTEDGNDDDERQRSQSVSPSPSRFNHTSPSAGGAIPQLSPSVPKPSRLSSNLSELDSLLNDISSAKFYTEVDKTSQNTLGNHRISPQPSGTLGSRPASRSGTLQRDQEIPKLIVPPIQPNASCGNYDEFDSCHGTVLQGSYVPQQSSVAGYTLITGTSQNLSNGLQDNVVPTNVQRPPIHQLQSGDQYAVGAAGTTFQVQPPEQQQPLKVQQQHRSTQQQVQRLQPRRLPDALVMQQHGQTAIQPQGQGHDQEEYDLLGPGDYKQTVTERYTEEDRTVNQPPHSVVNLPPQQHFTNQTTTVQQQQQQQQQAASQPLQQQRLQLATGQPLQPVEQHQQVIIHETVTTRGAQGAGLPPGRALSASKDLEELMASFSEFDVSKGGNIGGEALYARPVKTIQVPVVPTGEASGDSTDAAAGFRNSQEQSSSGHLSVSQSGHGDIDGGAAPGSASPGPRETIIQPSPSTLGHPVPSTVYSQGQSTSKVIVTQGMHGVLPQGGGGGGGGVGDGGHVGEGQLETMLNQLGNDLSQQGILTLPKGDCAACKKTVVGQVLMALGNIWHPEHFVCGHCKQELGTNIFFERDGVPYCENDYQILFSPKCALCGGAILEKCITALNKTWHPEHFFCAQCQRPFDDEGFHEQNGMPYCRDDYFCTFAPKCGGCGNAILSNYFTALQRQWHPECFVCRECYAPFESGSFFDHNGLPYCEQHFHARRGSLCAACQQPILGRCVTAMNRKFHPEHFVCVFCLQPLNKGTFKEQSGKPYCHHCFEKLFG